MEKFMILGGNRLKGTIRAAGSKNATLPILAACILNAGKSVIHEVPRLLDVSVMKDVLTHLGAKVYCDRNTVEVDSSNVQPVEISEDLMRRMRASNLVLGALLGRFGRVKISYPGGCQIGSRPMNLHLKGLQLLGATIQEKFGYITAEADRLVGADIHLDLPSVGATENLIMAAVLAEGVTFIRNVAKEPELVDLQNFLNSIGARVKGAGTDAIKIEGVRLEDLKPASYTIIPDRIEAGTFMVSAAMTGGDVTITNVIPEHLDPLLAKLREAGVNISVGDDWVRVLGNGRIKAVDIKTMPYPGFPTDMQPQMMALLSLAKGTSVITETIFENRFKHVGELRRMGADIKVEGQTAIIKGVDKLSGAYIEASDLRAGAALVMSALAAEGGTVLEKVQHIDRGYERLEVKYNALGARIIRVHN
ncbi:UDP-N-acetylglucosamine 1-carboxyvinyltransferase [Pelotomaculum terephthalicicum JT]|uniref:UDP-N-acetylglucosamine 1-carboxyvinyltransferase n=1 Tax=Pelotomaculum TaxID=191373 RepID=UPI0009D61E6B|nr:MULTISPECIES: UDP-N-acetylglucosamine 1-carboxyvinyltransferase [Pelotomaculum]MCG9968076.1 UDP-N-acetylglucosamine 1-carboxyvinyltransferase [Pelotomaculum terephthalicicum JT]OPX85625.1 MAG: UDP-N-acetylglucosamine 1-carboxyvinyltransferase 1 [Pelotomaculum sp. PtaB.Bin117]OPY64003.1 MAG: UDP-N-acetylglucosamine 1-carboxyvinyltransferase 1 [Pelotomaculum sp. PtaU1.Bin065]